MTTGKKKSNIIRKIPSKLKSGKNRIIIRKFPRKEKTIYTTYIYPFVSLTGQGGKKVWWLKLPPHTTFSPCLDKSKFFQKGTHILKNEIKFCPLINADCKEEKCAWYNEKYEECSALSTGNSLIGLKKMADDLGDGIVVRVPELW